MWNQNIFEMVPSKNLKTINLFQEPIHVHKIKHGGRKKFLYYFGHMFDPQTCKTNNIFKQN